jgi:hypothetical protein
MHSRTLTSCQSRETTIEERGMRTTVVFAASVPKVTNVMRTSTLMAM